MIFGCVADDFTGASDGASFLKKAGLHTILMNGIPEKKEENFTADAVVIALKSRTQEREEAVKECLDAFQWLRAKGAKILYFKYCSTFDSTDRGNIGPVIDAVLEKYQYPYTLLCPSLPVNGRTVRQGKLYVNGVLLENSSMREHPLTPMKKSRLADLMEKQGKYSCLETGMPVDGSFYERLQRETSGGSHCYIVPDYETDEQGKEIADTFSEAGFYTGGSGLMEHLANKLKAHICHKETTGFTKKRDCSSVILAGSCSQATLEQIEEYQKRGLPSYKILPERILNGELNAKKIWSESGMANQKIGMIYSSASPNEVQELQKKEGKERISGILEKTMADLAKIAVSEGMQNIIAAGGETSGAILKALGYQSYWIGNSIAPGVPIMIPVTEPSQRLALKSGNFGQKDFFTEAVKKMEEG